MRRLPLLVAAAALLAAPASADLWLFEGVYSLGGIADPAPVGTGVGLATVNGSGGGIHVSSLQVPGGLVSVQSTTTPTGTSPPYTKLIVSMTPGAGSFAGGSGTGTLSGVLPVPGNVRVCFLLDCALAVDVPFTENGTRGVGIGGTVTASTFAGGTLSLFGDPWADTTASISTSAGVATSPGFAHGPASLTSSTAQTSGVLQLVTPVQIDFTASGSPPLTLATFASLRVRFLPEPAWFAGLAAGAALLVALGRRRRVRGR